jgi:hypothetical protein
MLIGFGSAVYCQNLPVSRVVIEKAVDENSVGGFGATFCMFNAVEYKPTGLLVTIYSTYRVADCNSSEYEKLTAVSIARQLQTFMKPSEIVKSGTHTIVMSKDLSPLNYPYISIGKFSFSRAGEISVGYLRILYLHITDARFREGYIGFNFNPLRVSGDIFYLYDPGLTVYELISPDRKTYTMTTFTNLINPDLNIENLKDLGSSLLLPKGWTFSSRILDKPIRVQSRLGSQQIEHIFDNLGNIYVQTQ